MAPPSDNYVSSTNSSVFHKLGDEMAASILGNIKEVRVLEKTDSFEKEKQISIDPISLRELAPVKVAGLMELPAALLPGKPKFLSCSLPSSANTSPRFLKKIRNENRSQVSPSPLRCETVRNPNDVDATEEEINDQPNLPLEFFLRRSKSCGEGRSFAPSDDFDLWLDKPGFGSKPEDRKHFPSFSKSGQMTSTTNRKVNKRYDDADMSSSDDGFKCGACLFLPGFGKAKTIRSSLSTSTSRNKDDVVIVTKARNSVAISRTVSLEKFECGSWASTAIGDGEFATNNYFDLPMELIRSGTNDANSPVSAAFLFDKDVKGVLKNGSRSMSARKSHDSGRHVRFSTASPMSYPASPASCITPRLRKAREDFNAFLEAQSA